MIPLQIMKNETAEERKAREKKEKEESDRKLAQEMFGFAPKGTWVAG